MLVDTAMKQVSQFAKVISHIYEMVNKAREDWDVEASSRSGVQQTSSLSDTHALVAAIGMGKGKSDAHFFSHFYSRFHIFSKNSIIYRFNTRDWSK